MSETLKALRVGRELLEADLCLLELCSVVNGSPATVKRLLAYLRTMGCSIEAIRRGSGFVYRLVNRDSVRERLLCWLDLELRQTLV